MKAGAQSAQILLDFLSVCRRLLCAEADRNSSYRKFLNTYLHTVQQKIRIYISYYESIPTNVIGRSTAGCIDKCRVAAGAVVLFLRDAFHHQSKKTKAKRQGTRTRNEQRANGLHFSRITDPRWRTTLASRFSPLRRWNRVAERLLRSGAFSKVLDGVFFCVLTDFARYASHPITRVCGT